jgi:mono/diheme cytochrome c family protein
MRRTDWMSSGIHRFVYGVGVLAIVLGAAGALYAASMVRSGFSTRERPSTLEAAGAQMMRHLAMSSHARTMVSPVSVSASALAAARMHWADHCAICHAANGSGETDIGRNVYPPAPDMRGDTVQSRSDGELYSVIQNGVRLTAMPAWGAARDDDPETWALVAFIRTLPSMPPDVLSEVEAAQPRSMHELEEDMREREFLRTP